MSSQSYQTIQRGSTRYVSTSTNGSYESSSVTYDTPLVACVTTTTRESVSTPGFRSRKRPIPLPMNAFSFKKVTDNRSTGFIMDQSVDRWPNGTPKTVSTTSGVLGTQAAQPIGAPIADIQAADRKAQNSLLLKIKDQKVNLFQALAERDQAARMIGNNAIRIAKAIASVKKGNWSGAADALGVKRRSGFPSARDYRRAQSKAIASGWLELQYGWRPLINDVYGAAEAVANANYGTPREKVVQTVRLSGSSFNTARPSANQLVTDMHTYDVSIKYVCYFSAGNQLVKSLSEVGITNPVLIAWELMPYSFVVDWFIPVGNFISTFDATLGLTFDRGCRTIFQRLKCYTNITHGPSDGTGGIRSGNEFALREEIRCDRSLLGNFPSPQIPSFKSPLGIEHMLNALALLRSKR